MRCPQCASENPADYRFCGMCGTPLEKAAPVAEPVTRSAKPEEPVTVPADEILARVEKFKPKSRSNGGTSLLGLNDTEAPHTDRRLNETSNVRSDRAPFDLPPQPADRAEPATKPVEWGAHRDSPAPSTISGPSFLGLGGDPPRGGYAETSRDLNYLFDEDEQPRRSYGRFIGILLVLAVLAGLGYLQYKRSGGSWTPPWAKGPAQTPIQASQPQPGDQTNVGENSGQSTSASNTPPAGQSPATTETNQPPNTQDRSTNSTLKEQDLPPQGSQGQAAVTPPAGKEVANAAPTDKGDTGNNKEGTTETASSAPGPGAKGATDNAKSADANDSESDTKEAGSARASKDRSAASDNADEAAADVPAKTAKPVRTKPSPQVASPDDTLVTNAEKYLYGRGVPQNCDRALISLRAAANRQNSRAMTLLGTMYGTGHCVGRDLPNSYRWFAQASRQSPDNTWINRNLEMIWREMTPAERQLATARQ